MFALRSCPLTSVGLLYNHNQTFVRLQEPMEDRTMRTVKYSELSRAMHDFTKQIDTLDECIEVGLVSGEKVQISISASCPEANPERVAEFAKHLSEVAVAAKNFKYTGCTIVR